MANQSELINKSTLMLIILIFCAACLGSMPIASYLLPTVQKSIATVPVTTYPDGQCNATAKTVVYQPTKTSKGKQTQIVLPPGWSKTGYKQQDFANVQACAAAFVESYQSFDYHNLNTLQSAIFMLSSTAKERFYEGSKNVSKSLRLNTQWQKKIQQQKMVQTAQLSQPTMLDSEYTDKTLYVTFDVPYQLITRVSGKTTTENYHEVVLLKSVAPDMHSKGTGWQISDYRYSNQ